MQSDITIGDIICNSKFDINCNYKIYYDIWNDGGKLLWDTKKQGELPAYNNLTDWVITYITLDTDGKTVIFEADTVY